MIRKICPTAHHNAKQVGSTLSFPIKHMQDAFSWYQIRISCQAASWRWASTKHSWPLLTVPVRSWGVISSRSVKWRSVGMIIFQVCTSIYPAPTARKETLFSHKLNERLEEGREWVGGRGEGGMWRGWKTLSFTQIGDKITLLHFRCLTCRA